MNETAPGSDFWQFSLKLYSHPPVQQVCLEWQQIYELDVSQLLFAVWQASRQIQTHPDDIKSLIQTVAEWRQQVILPLRTVRQQLKDNAVAKSGVLNAVQFPMRSLYQGVLQQEIEAEHYQQLVMENTRLQNSRQVETDFATLTKLNLGTYLANKGLDVQKLEHRLDTLVKLFVN